MDDRKLEELILRARGGDRDAAEALARAYEQRVRAHIRYRLAPDLRPRIDTDDVFQSTFAASLEDLAGLEFRGEKAFVAWLSKVAERRVVDAARRHRAEKRDVRRQRPLEAAHLMPGHLTSPTGAAIRQEIKESMRHVLAKLPERERQVIELRSYEGLPFREVAERLGLVNRHVARDLYRAALRKVGDLFGALEAKSKV